MRTHELDALVRPGKLKRDRPAGVEEPKCPAPERRLRYALTSHARRVMAERGIRTAWLEETLVSLERVERDPVDPEVSHRLRKIPDMGDRVLRVVYNHTAEPNRVVSVFFDRRLRGKL